MRFRASRAVAALGLESGEQLHPTGGKTHSRPPNTHPWGVRSRALATSQLIALRYPSAKPCSEPLDATLLLEHLAECGTWATTNLVLQGTSSFPSSSLNNPHP